LIKLDGEQIGVIRMALIAKLSHYLGPDLKVVKIPGPAAALREFLGCIVEAVTSRDPDDLNNVDFR